MKTIAMHIHKQGESHVLERLGFGISPSPMSVFAISVDPL